MLAPAIEIFRTHAASFLTGVKPVRFLSRLQFAVGSFETRCHKHHHERCSGAVREKGLKRTACSSNVTSLRAGKLKGWELSKPILNIKTGNLKRMPSAPKEDGF